MLRTVPSAAEFPSQMLMSTAETTALGEYSRVCGKENR
jgi:hypothetical protein